MCLPVRSLPGNLLLSILALFVSDLAYAQQLTHTCKFDKGPRAGQTLAYPAAQPIPVGAPCRDGVASTGVAVPDDPNPQLTHSCKFDQGPRAGQIQAYPNARPAPVGAPCADGVASTGVAIADNTSVPEPVKPPAQNSVSLPQQVQKRPAQQPIKEQESSQPRTDSALIQPAPSTTAAPVGDSQNAANDPQVATYTSAIESGRLQGKALAEAYEKRAALYLKLGKFELARKEIIAAGNLRGIAVSQEHIAAIAHNFFLLGQADMGMKHYYLAADRFVDAANKTKPPNAKYYRFAAYAKVLQAWTNEYKSDIGNYGAAMFDYRKAVDLDAAFAKLSGSPVAEARAQYDRAVTFFKANQFVDAIGGFDEAIRLDPQYLDAYLMRGAAHFQTKQFVEAVDDYNNAIFLQPTNNDAYINLSLVYEQAGDLRSAEKVLYSFAGAGNILGDPATPLGVIVKTQAQRERENQFTAHGMYRMCAFYYRNRASKAEYLRQAATQCASASRLDPGNQEYAALATAVQAANARVAAQEKQQRDAQIRDAFMTIGTALVGLLILSDVVDSNKGINSVAVAPHRDNSNDWPIINLGREEESQRRKQNCGFVSQSNMTLNDGRAFTGGPGTKWVCH